MEIEDKDWFTARKQLPFFAWIELVLALLALIVSVGLFYFWNPFDS